MKTNMPKRLEKVAEEMAKYGRTEYKTTRRPRMKEYTLIKYDGKKEISREKILVNEAKLFPLDEDFFWEPKRIRWCPALECCSNT